MATTVVPVHISKKILQEIRVAGHIELTAETAKRSYGHNTAEERFNFSPITIQTLVLFLKENRLTAKDLEAILTTAYAADDRLSHPQIRVTKSLTGKPVGYTVLAFYNTSKYPASR